MVPPNRFLQLSIILFIAVVTTNICPQANAYNVWFTYSESDLPYTCNHLPSGDTYNPHDQDMAERWNLYSDIFDDYTSRYTPEYDNERNDQVGMQSDAQYNSYFDETGGWGTDAASTFRECLLEEECTSSTDFSEYSDIAYNSGTTWTTDKTSTLSGKLFQGSALHELGHAIGLAHNFNDMSVMNYHQPMKFDDHLMPDDVRYLYDRFPNKARTVTDMGVWASTSEGYKSYATATVVPWDLNPGEQVQVDGIYVGNLKNGTQSGSVLEFFLSADTDITTNDTPIGNFLFNVWPRALGSKYDNFILTVPGSMNPGMYYVGMIIYANGTSPDSITYNNSAYVPFQIQVCSPPNISPTYEPFDSDGGYGTVSVEAQRYCHWDVSSSASWIVITSGNDGVGNGTVNYTVNINRSESPRTGTINITGQELTVYQFGVGCNKSIDPTGWGFGYSAGSGSVNVSSPSNCSWNASSNDSWITITSGDSGSGTGTVNYSVAANVIPGPFPIVGGARTGHLIIAGQLFTVSQDGIASATTTTTTTSSTTTSTHGGSCTICHPGAQPTTTTTTTTTSTTTTTIVGLPCQCPTGGELGCISGRANNISDGSLLAGKVVKLKRTFPRKPRTDKKQRAVTDSNGCYHFSGLIDGTYKLKVKRCRGGVKLRYVTINGGAKIDDVDFTCKK